MSEIFYSQKERPHPFWEEPFSKAWSWCQGERVERVEGFEPPTSTLARLCSTPELRPRKRWVLFKLSVHCYGPDAQPSERPASALQHHVNIARRQLFGSTLKSASKAPTVCVRSTTGTVGGIGRRVEVSLNPAKRRSHDVGGVEDDLPEPALVAWRPRSNGVLAPRFGWLPRQRAE
jgi:hypothetical protein